MSIFSTRIGEMPDGREVKAYTLQNKSGAAVKISDFGCTVMQLIVPDRDGKMTDIVCGYDNFADYMAADGYQGALIGRFANRIANGSFSLDGKEYKLATNNNGINHLHGGDEGFSHKLWEFQAVGADAEDSLTLFYTSPDGEEGYPGELSVRVKYTLTDENALMIEYSAKTDKKTILNLTNHTYFNLGGYAWGEIHDHVLRLDADTYLPTDAGLIPTGELRGVVGTPFDFREPKEIGRDIGADDADLLIAGGYDHCINFTGGAAKTAILRGELYHPATGRVMELYTDCPAVQLYSANFMINQNFRFKGGLPQRKQCALCLETQRMPDSINHPSFTNCVLEPGQEFLSTTIYKFLVK